MMRCIRYILVSFCFCFLSLSNAQELTSTLVYGSLKQKNSELFLQAIDNALWGASVGFYNEWGNIRKSNILSVRIQSRYDYYLQKNLKFNTEFSFNAGQTGTIESSYGRKESAFFEFLSLYISWKTVTDDYSFSEYFNGLVLETRIGILNQNYLKAPLLITNWGFIGVMEELTWDRYTSPYVDKARLVFQQSLPYGWADLGRLGKNSRPVNEEFEDQEGDGFPLFFTGSLFLEKNYQEMIMVKGSLTGFYFKDISSGVVYEGYQYGNVVENTYDGSNATSLFPFYGIYTQAATYLDLFAELDVELGFAFLWNLGAFSIAETKEEFFKFSTFNKAQSLFIKLYIPLLLDITLIPSVERFVSQSNAAPAYYNDPRYGRSRREGFIIGARFQFKKYNFYLNVDYGVIRSITQSDPVGNPDYILFSIGRDYENQI